MKNFNALLSGLCLTICLLIACTEADNTLPPTEEQVITVTDTPATESLQLTNVPIFDSISITETPEASSPDGPGSLGPTPVGNVIDRKQVRVIPKIDLIIKKNNVNGTLTARAPYLNSSAWLDIYNGNTIAGNNSVECGCNKAVGATQLKLVLQVKADKIYVIRVKAKPKNERAEIATFTSGFITRNTITTAAPGFEVLFSPTTNGSYDFWMQCTSPNTRSEPWRFESLTINEVDKP